MRIPPRSSNSPRRSPSADRWSHRWSMEALASHSIVIDQPLVGLAGRSCPAAELATSYRLSTGRRLDERTQRYRRYSGSLKNECQHQMSYTGSPGTSNSAGTRRHQLQQNLHESLNETYSAIDAVSSILQPFPSIQQVLGHRLDNNSFSSRTNVQKAASTGYENETPYTQRNKMLTSFRSLTRHRPVSGLSWFRSCIGWVWSHCSVHSCSDPFPRSSPRSEIGLRPISHIRACRGQLLLLSHILSRRSQYHSKVSLSFTYGR